MIPHFHIIDLVQCDPVVYPLHRKHNILLFPVSGNGQRFLHLYLKKGIVHRFEKEVHCIDCISLQRILRHICHKYDHDRIVCFPYSLCRLHSIDQRHFYIHKNDVPDRLIALDKFYSIFIDIDFQFRGILLRKPFQKSRQNFSVFGIILYNCNSNHTVFSILPHSGAKNLYFSSTSQCPLNPRPTKRTLSICLIWRRMVL